MDILIDCIKIAMLTVFAYLLGSIPFGLVATRFFTDVDIRREGSGNIGATNVRRTAGNIPGLLTLVGDSGKGMLPVYWAACLSIPDELWKEIGMALAATASVCGHFLPLFLKGKGGGKGVATLAGCFLIISPAACFKAFLFFLIGCIGFKRVSVGSLGGAVALPMAVWSTTRSMIFSGCALVLCVGVVWRHASNIKRLLAGTEPRSF